jgi:hypothetical protein
MTMRIPRVLLLLAWLAPATLPALAQALPDGPAYGGSKVFSLGLNPLGNSARFDQAAPGWYLGRVTGDLQPKDQPDALAGLAALSGSDSTGQPLALTRLAENPWAQRTTGYSMTWAKAGGIHGSLSREEYTGLLATVDLDPAHRGGVPALALNTSAIDVRRAVVNRVVTGVGSMSDGVAYGFALRFEDWHFGQEVRALNPAAGQQPLGNPKEVLTFASTTEKRTTATLDGGVVVDVAQGLRLGGMVDRLLPATFGDIKEQSQVRVGLQLDLGTMAQLAAEADLNEATRLPFAAKQKSASVSLRILAGPSVQLLVGAERKTLAGAATTALGATLYFRFGNFHVGGGFRFAQDRPLLGLGVKVE